MIKEDKDLNYIFLYFLEKQK